MSVRKKVLGKGLASLIGGGTHTEGGTGMVGSTWPSGGAAAGAPPGQSFFLCPVEEVFAGSSQPRKSFDPASLAELSASIRENGVIEPLIVRKVSGGYELIAGERRLRASKLAGLAEVPVVTIDATDEKSLEFAIVENIQREDLNAIEEAEAYQSLMDFGFSQEQVAKKVGKERATVANYLRLLKLPLEIKEELVKGTISMGHARAILSVEGHAAQTELCRKVVSKGLSVREAERLASTPAHGAKKSARPSAQDPAMRTLEDELRDIFGTKVTVKERGGKGRVEISYFSADERERVVDLLRSLIA